MEILVEPFQFEFFRNGLMVAVLVGGLCGLIGVYIVLRGMSYIGHGLSHAIFGGAVVAFVMVACMSFKGQVAAYGAPSTPVIPNTTAGMTVTTLNRVTPRGSRVVAASRTSSPSSEASTAIRMDW